VTRHATSTRAVQVLRLPLPRSALGVLARIRERADRVREYRRGHAARAGTVCQRQVWHRPCVQLPTADSAFHTSGRNCSSSLSGVWPILASTLLRYRWCAGHGSMTWRCKSSGDLCDGNPYPNSKGCRREAGSERSCKQSSGPRNTNRMRRRRVGERARRLEARCHTERVGVDAADRWSEGHQVLPREICRSVL